MKKIQFLIQLLSLAPMLAIADIPLFDIVKLKMDNEIVYLRYESMGVLRKGDFCYYEFYKNQKE